MNTPTDSDGDVRQLFALARAAAPAASEDTDRILRTAVTLADRRARRRRSSQLVAAVAATVILGGASLTFLGSDGGRSAVVAGSQDPRSNTAETAIEEPSPAGGALRVGFGQPTFNSSDGSEIGEVTVTVSNDSGVPIQVDRHFSSDVQNGWYLVGAGCGPSTIDGSPTTPSCDRALISEAVAPAESIRIPLRIICAAPPCALISGSVTLPIRYSTGDAYDPTAPSVLAVQFEP